MYIGICGKQGSGKSTLSKYLLDNLDNYICIDIDKIGHLINNLDNVKEELITVFGDSILINNQIDRKTLGKIVFNNKDKMKLLEDITWKYMEEEIDKLIGNRGNVIFDWMLLPKVKYFKMCNIRILLDIPYEIRKERIIKRDHLDDNYFNIREENSINYNHDDFDIIMKDNNYDINKIKVLLKD